MTRNATTTAYPHTRCTHELFAAQAERTPDALAVTAAAQSLSYRALDQRANQLAWYLQQLGLAPQVCVGLCLERTLDLLVALLAIWKAGAAFLPLDPAVPAARLAFMLEDAQAPLLLTQQHLRARLSSLPARLLCLDSLAPLLCQLPTTPPPSAVTAAHLAYLIYTSGSSGTPKGVLVPHAGLVNYLDWAGSAYTAAAGCGAPVQSSIAADAIFPSLLLPLLCGTTVELLPEQQPLAALAGASRPSSPSA